MEKLVIKKCLKCGATIMVLQDCNCDNCGIVCCGVPMIELKPNSVDAAVEKHVPVYQVKGDNILASVNHVMDADHYIEWIALLYKQKLLKVDFGSGQVPQCTLPYCKGSTLFAYCNKHGLWSKEVQ